MIRHTVEVKADPALRNAELTASLPNLRDGDCLKLIQDDHILYLTYRLTQSMGQHQSKKASLPLHLMRLNRIEEGSCIVEQCSCSRIEHLKVKVSELDEKIVNDYRLRIAESFLEQISVVWPGSIVPIYYDDVNYVILSPDCLQARRLDVNTTVQFIQERESADNQGHCKNSDEDEVQSEQQIEQQLALNGYCECPQGWLNVINVSHSILQKMNIEQSQPWIVNNNIDFEGCPTIQQLTEFQNAQQSEQNQHLISSKKLVILQTDQLSQLVDGQYQCSKVCKNALGISDSLSLSHSPASKPLIQTISWELFINDPNWWIVVEELILDEKEYSEIEYMQIAASIIKKFVIYLAAQLYQKGGFWILPDQYPFCQGSILLLVKLQHKKKAIKPGQIYQLKLTNNNLTTEQYQQQLTKSNKVMFSSKKYPSPQGSTLEERYNLITSWISVLRQHNKYERERQESAENITEQANITLFNSIYQPQIDKIMNFLENSSQQVCLVTSLGSNGKSLLHRVLYKERQPMWKINMRELTNPSLTYKNIEFYLHWIFANSPYRIVFLDDLDALCGKVQEGDQAKKKEKVISRLILRAIERYAGVYMKRIIATSRSQNSIDQLFNYHTHITLKNPNRQARINAIKELHVVVEPDDSPVHKFSNQLAKKKVTSERVEEIAESTESLTLAAFAQHAIALSVPQNKVSSSAEVDFSKLAGLTAAKLSIKRIIEKPLKYAFLFKSVPIKLPRGVLLYGATGNGKSALGSALKAECKMKYFSVKGSDILSKYIGGSEAAVRDIFEKALSVSPSIIFFDEFQSIVPRRSANNTGVNDRIVNQFLCYLDGVSSTAGVFIVAASSRPDLIDPAVLRPGRLDAHLFLDYPSEEERRELLHMFGTSVQIDVEEATILKQTQNYSYSDMIGLMKQLRIKRSAEVLKQENFESKQFRTISAELFDTTIKEMKLSVNVGEQKRQRNIYESFRDGKVPDVREQKQILQ